MSLGQRTARTREQALGTAARSSNSQTPALPGRYRAIVIANNGGGSYQVTILDAQGATLVADVRALAWPLEAASIAVDTAVIVTSLAGSPVYEIDATAVGIAGSGGSAIGGIVSVGAPGFIANT